MFSRLLTQGAMLCLLTGVYAAASQPLVAQSVGEETDANFARGQEKVDPKCKTLDWTNIKKPEDAVCFESIEKAFEKLPESIKPNFIFMRETRSAQPSTVDYPRVLMVSPNGTFLIGAATSPDSPKKDLEVAVYDQVNSVWNFAGIDFSTKPPAVEKELCKSCHGQKPHPIWGAYGAWKGAYAENNFLKADEAAFLNRLAAGDANAHPVLKTLTYRKSYKESERIHPKAKAWGGEEASQILNYVAMQKAAESTVKTMLTNPDISALDLVKMSAEISCKTKSGTMKTFGYSIQDNLRFVMEGVDKPNDQFNGLFNASVYLSVELLARAVEKDPELKAKLSIGTKYLDDERYGYFKTKTLEEFIDWQTKTKTSLRGVMSDFLYGQFFTSLKGAAYCKVVKSLNAP